MFIAFGDATPQLSGAIAAHCRAIPSKAQLTVYVIENKDLPLLGREVETAKRTFDACRLGGGGPASDANFGICGTVDFEGGAVDVKGFGEASDAVDFNGGGASTDSSKAILSLIILFF
ncbi:UNVERIFIED_CONTAM: hypothetical protein K2H54_009375 [Gekko kuhli]